MTNGNVIAYGLDYLRYKIFSSVDLEYIARELCYLNVNERWFHGKRFVDITGKQLELVRLFQSVDVMAKDLAYLYPCTRVDVFIDVQGDLLPKAQTTGTEIMNDGRVETKYSTHLASRGDVPRFGRAYDAMIAGHYDIKVTRFEVEYKNFAAKALLNVRGWSRNPVECAMRDISTMFGIDIEIDGLNAVELDAPTTRLEHNRERFYRRYGKGILIDISDMGSVGLLEYIQRVIEDKNGENKT